MEDMEMRNLVLQVEQGNQEAFTKLYEETSKTVYFICLSFLNNEEDAKDIMQDVYITAYNYLPQLNEKEKFQAWINQIAVNKCKRFLMKHTAIPMDDEDLSNIKLEDNENFLPEEYITKKEKRKIVMNIMRERLSDIQYETVILYYFNGLTIDEIADIMECPPGTVKYRLSVARGKIKEGVLEYEKTTDDKLYSFATVPFLASLLAAEASGLEVPHLAQQIINTLSQTSTVGVAAKTGLATLKVKIAVGVAAVALVGGAIAALVIHNNNKDEEKDNKDTVESQIDESDDVQDDVLSGVHVEQSETEAEESLEQESGSQQNNEWMTADEMRDMLISEFGFTYDPADHEYIWDDKSEARYILRYDKNGIRSDLYLQYRVNSNHPVSVSVSQWSTEPNNYQLIIDVLCSVCSTEEGKELIRGYAVETPISEMNGLYEYVDIGNEVITIWPEEPLSDQMFEYTKGGEIMFAKWFLNQ